jgi:hypothetical protein
MEGRATPIIEMSMPSRKIAPQSTASRAYAREVEAIPPVLLSQ